MKKSVEIVTFHNAYNYGAVLQCYALKTIIRREGYVSTVRNHQNEQINRAYAPKLFIKSRSPKRIIRNAMAYPRKLKRHKAFYPFIKQYILDRNSREEDIEEKKYICGSDQVWNCDISHFDKTYFLDFVNRKEQKNAFSASFGFDSIPEEYRSEYKRLLSDFNKITVREQQGANIIGELLGINVPVTLDPSLLLNRNDWEAIASPVREKEKYILLYLMEETESIISFALRLKQVTGLQILYISDETSHKIKGIKYKSFITPQKWLSLFLYADYVVTNSFHGMVFSINFHRNLFVDFLPPPAKVNSRLENVIQLFGLQNRVISSFKSKHIANGMSYVKIDRILTNERKRSLQYLRGILDE